MNRLIFMLCALLAALLASPAAQAWLCPMIKVRPPDCGRFPHDRNIMVIPPGGEGVVARYYWQEGRVYIHRLPREGESGGQWRGLRVFNNLDRPLPIFLRTREEFNAFKEYAKKEPGISTCSVVDGTWFLEGCLDRDGAMLDACPYHVGTYAVRERWRCHGAKRDCDGRCSGGFRDQAVKMRIFLRTR